MNDYNLDYVLCIDGTASMGPIIREIKRSVTSLYDKIKAIMTEDGVGLGQLRVKVIVFGDYRCDDKPMRISPFYLLSEDERDESAAFREFVEDIVAEGGGDCPEDGFEALAYAMQSDWDRSQGRSRYIIQLFTDADAHEMGANFDCAGYPDDLPKNFSELTALWESMDRRRRLFLVAPQGTLYEDCEKIWDNTMFFPAQCGMGGGDLDIDECINFLSYAICG